VVEAAKKTAVFRGLYLGDLVAATPALRALRRGHPGAETSLVGLSWAAALAPHLAPDVDRFVPYPGAPGLDGDGDEAALDGFVEEMRAERFDLAVNLHDRGPQSTRLVASFGARRTAGFVGGEGDHPSLDVSVSWDGTDVGYLVRRMRCLLEDPEEARRLGEAGRRTIRERFGLERFARDWEAAFAGAVPLREEVPCASR
jgi:ADP-heptose:LPS heptosyltransferase